MAEAIDLIEARQTALIGDNHFLITISPNETWKIITIGAVNTTRAGKVSLIQVFQASGGRGANLSPPHVAGGLNDMNHVFLNEVEFQSQTQFKINFYDCTAGDILNYYVVFKRSRRPQ